MSDTTTTPKTVTAVYVGRRITTKQKLAYFWHFDGETSISGFRKQLVWAQIGECWRFTINAQGHYVTGGDGAPERVAEADEASADTKHFVALDAAAYRQDQQGKAARALKNRRSQFERALAPLRDLVHHAVSYAEREALIHLIAAELWRPPQRPAAGGD